MGWISWSATSWTPKPPVTDADVLARVIAASGLSARQYALTVLLRDERTVRRWLSGDSPIPKPVIAHLCAADDPRLAIRAANLRHATETVLRQPPAPWMIPCHDTTTDAK